MLTEQVKLKKDNDKIKKVGPNVERLWSGTPKTSFLRTRLRLWLTDSNMYHQSMF